MFFAPASFVAALALAGAPATHDTTELRGTRYCEVLAGGLSGLHVALDVYNTIGLNDCPDAAWARLDVARIKAQLGAREVKLNGPRCWTLDAFVGSKLLDATAVEIDGLPMRKAGRLELPVSDALSAGKPYVRHTVRRDTIELFRGGKPVFELIDAGGSVYVMQSYSLQKVQQDLDSLATLGARLHLPAGWRFRTRTPAADLRVRTVDGHATVVQDDFENTYQLAVDEKP